ncbi:hypothetical protein FRC10_006387 [Ceratobasidium sp. 414]|nr:hypothetical protein FRC10_006387 [Ceratobasidium sp. 414]
MSMASVLSPLPSSFGAASPVPWPASYTLTSIGDYPFGPPQDETPEAYAERRYLECLWMPDVLEPLSNLVPSLRRVAPPNGWSPTLGSHPLHAIIDEHLLDLADIHKKYRKTIPALLVKEGDAQNAEEACIWYAWTHAHPDDAEHANTGAEQEDKWTKAWLHEAEKRECLVQIILRMLKLTLPPPSPEKQKKRKKRSAEEDPEVYVNVIAGLEMLADRIGIMHQTAVSALQKEKEKPTGKECAKTRDWAAVFCDDVLKPLFEEALPEHYETIRYHCVPVPSRPASPAHSDASVVEIPKPQSRERSLARSTSASTRSGSLHALSQGRTLSREDSQTPLIPAPSRQSRSRSGSIEPSLGLGGRSRSRSRSVSFAARSAGGIRAPAQRPGGRPTQGPRGKAKIRQVNSAPSGGVGKQGTNSILRMNDCILMGMLGRTARIAAPEASTRAQTTGPTTLVAATPQKTSRTMDRETSTSSIPFFHRLQGVAGGSQSQTQSHTQRKVSIEDSGLGEFMVASPERSRDDFMLGDMVLATPTK